MCDSQGWKSSGDKSNIIRRFIKKIKAATTGHEGVSARVESAVGPTVAGGLPAQVRRHYTTGYAALDRFDRLWYEMKFPCRSRDWKSYFCWGLIHCAVINARAAWCLASNQRVTIKDFLAQLVADARENVHD